MKLRDLFSLLVLAIVMAGSATAQNDIYDNGPTNGTTDAWTINFGFAVGDSFTVGPNTTVQGLNFAAWLIPGDVLESAEVSITSSEFGGTSYFDQVVGFTQSGCVSNQYGYNVCSESGNFPYYPNLDGGTYWLNLSNAIVNSGDPVYWDENSGPSSASENTIGTIPSESFTLLGYSSTCMCGCGVNPNCGPPSPEPGSFLLLGSGGAVLCALLIASRRFF